ncbi:hypothetical protein SAMN05444000_10424 [Shimia gijangensis]|uniref:Uncharacterized protein n=1 Tax=Shimia gijangensis TaxID=1470563 RepID=A0A1M6FB84_9RHOB|nr:hypothetical protein [Shimia gijangensis]SHI95004.1 hypothetical protein SAMN05444000_10424 [Shimia gijangensis]
MSFIRPEARAAMLRWRETMLGLLVVLLGLYWATGFGILKWVGVALLVAGTGFVLAGVQRARFRGAQGGPGVVQVDERQITYFGPLDGGAVAIDDLSGVSLDARSDPPMWVLRQPGHPELHIPVNAKGTDALFDAFAALPGIRTEHMLTQLKQKPDHPVVIWTKHAARLH